MQRTVDELAGCAVELFDLSLGPQQSLLKPGLMRFGQRGRRFTLGDGRRYVPASRSFNHLLKTILAGR